MCAAWGAGRGPRGRGSTPTAHGRPPLQSGRHLRVEAVPAGGPVPDDRRAREAARRAAGGAGRDGGAYPFVGRAPTRTSRPRAPTSRPAVRAEKEYAALKEESEAESSRLRDQLARKEKELDTLDEFKTRKREMEETIEGLREQLREAKEQHERVRPRPPTPGAPNSLASHRPRPQKIADMARQSVQEKERLKREMLIKVKETKQVCGARGWNGIVRARSDAHAPLQNLLSMTEDQLHMTTKRTILENEQMSSELQYQSKQTEQLLQRNKDLTEQNSAMKQEVEVRRPAGHVWLCWTALTRPPRPAVVQADGAGNGDTHPVLPAPDQEAEPAGGDAGGGRVEGRGSAAGGTGGVSARESRARSSARCCSPLTAPSPHSLPRTGAGADEAARCVARAGGGTRDPGAGRHKTPAGPCGGGARGGAGSAG